VCRCRRSSTTCGEGLLPAGERTSPNQVRYDDRHVHRLRLIHALLEVGELSVAGACDVLADVADLLEPYADAAERLAVPEVEWVARGEDPDSLAERAVVGTVFGDAMVTALRRLAQAQESARRFDAAEDGPDR
jgi:DNA-binding transcriptional MerR regulator